MVKVEELRIGNFMVDTTENVSTRIGIGDLIVLNQSPGRYEPIPLTEEWFYKFGFSPSKAHDGITRYTKGALHIYGCCEYENGVAVEEFGVKFADIDLTIKTVHQLQNLYYTLTGQELTA